MKVVLFAGVLAFTLAAVSPLTLATKYSFDLSKGPVSFSYTTIGAYNPIKITIIGENGVAQTFLLSDYYQSQTLLQAMSDLLMQQRGAVPWVDLNVEALTGKLSFQASTQDGIELKVEMEGEQQNVTVKLETSGTDDDTSEKQVSAVVQVNAESGKLIVEDGSPKPDAETLLSQRYNIPPTQIRGFLDQFGEARVSSALETARDHFVLPSAGGNAVAGGAGSVAADGSVSFSELPPGEVFRISLWGLQYQGYLRDSTLYMRLLHPSAGISIRNMRVILTVVELNPPAPLRGPNIVLWDVFPYDQRSSCYLYHIDSREWRPGEYEIYIDVGRILNFKLPVTITDRHQMVPREG